MLRVAGGLTVRAESLVAPRCRRRPRGPGRGRRRRRDLARRHEQVDGALARRPVGVTDRVDGDGGDASAQVLVGREEHVVLRARATPGPNIATGQPPAGFTQLGDGNGVTTTKPTVSLPCTKGAPVTVGVLGMRRSPLSHDGASKRPNPTNPASPEADC